MIERSSSAVLMLLVILMTSASLFSDKSRDESEFAEQRWFSKFLNPILLFELSGQND